MSPPPQDDRCTLPTSSREPWEFSNGRQAASRRDQTASEQGILRTDSKRAAEIQRQRQLLSRYAQTMREDAQLIRSSAIALPVLLTTITTADTHIDILLDHLLDHVNLVRSRTSSWRYPLTRDSTEICHIKGKTNVQLTMMELARLGKAFDPNSRPDTLIPITANQLNDEEVDNLSLIHI